MRIRPIGAVLLAGVLVAQAAWAQGKGNEKSSAPKGGQSVGDTVREVLPPSEPVFTSREITIIRDYFRTNLGSLPPGLAKRETLPPGLQKQLVLKGTLPPGLQKQIHPLPVELERQLTLLPTGYRRVVIAGNVILMNPTTGLIYDIIRSVIP
ncbi:MAG TPA: hypothetical protein VNN17_13210 [Terriglobia bacterium]|nr:hypothetical protein [Terriglobia bacterium]